MPRQTYKDSWDLTTIPEAPFKSEVARRTRALGPRATYQNLQPCSKCGTQLNTVQRRKPCPECGWRNIKRSNTGQFIPNPHTPDQ